MNHEKKTKVIFISTVFGAVNTGPAIYANYLEEAFRNDPEIDFEMVVPSGSYNNKKIHGVAAGHNSLDFYKRIQTTALNIANSFPTPPILHTNNAHAIWKFRNYKGPILAQVNDYDAAHAMHNPFGKIRTYGLRRYSSLFWRRLKEKRATQFSTRFIFNSKYTQKITLQSYNSPSLRKSVVIYKAVDLDHFILPKSTEKFDFNLIGKQRILFLGANWRRKGLDLAIHALKKILPSNPSCALIVAGKKGQKADAAIAALPQKLGIAENVQFLGTVKREDLPFLFRECDLLTLPSREEALGVAILEAFASGLPVAGADVGGISEILGGCQHSVLVHPNDPSDLATAFQKILSSKSKRNDIQRECHTVANRFSKEVMIKKIKNLYLEIEASRT
ncbi:glycosyltransferase family 4 protein [bacterium]|nr:glycosyltransferase family 4 protein [bacterium]